MGDGIAYWRFPSFIDFNSRKSKYYVFGIEPGIDCGLMDSRMHDTLPYGGRKCAILITKTQSSIDFFSIHVTNVSRLND